MLVISFVLYVFGLVCLFIKFVGFAYLCLLVCFGVVCGLWVCLFYLGFNEMVGC